jgi:hypothetical protein
MISLVIEYQPHRALAHLKGKPVRRFAVMAPSYLEVGASGTTGEVQELDRRRTTR